MKLGKFEFDAKKLLPIASAALGLAGMIVSNKMQANERATMKSELKAELLEELAKTK